MLLSLSLSPPPPSLPPSLPPSETMFSWSLEPLLWVPRHCVFHLTSLNQSHQARPASIHCARRRQSSTHCSEGVTDDQIIIETKELLELIISFDINFNVTVIIMLI